MEKDKIENGRVLKFAKTKWDISNWTKEQKVAFQEECFRLGYGWFLGGREIESLSAFYYILHTDGDMTSGGSFLNFNRLDNIREMKWEDMFPDNVIEAGNLTNTCNHDCFCITALQWIAALNVIPRKIHETLRIVKIFGGY